jgi:predicted metal-dependent hydrolase
MSSNRREKTNFAVNMTYQPIDFEFKIETDLLQLKLLPCTGEHFMLRSTQGHEEILCPPEEMKKDEHFQNWFRNVIREALRKQAKMIFPSRLEEWSQRSHLHYHRLSIHCTSSKWGSYSGLGNLNLSLYLLLLDSKYIDYTMCHELCHSKEMNHGPQFWSLLNSLLNGQARQLSHEMHNIVKHWYETNDIRYLLMSNR